MRAQRAQRLRFYRNAPTPGEPLSSSRDSSEILYGCVVPPVRLGSVNSHRLQPHPRTPGEFVQGIGAAAALGPGAMRLRYRLDGDPRRIRIPSAAGGGRTDGLWKHTCLEAFVRIADAPQYLELNFSPSGQWAAYRFEGYREGMRPLELEEAPRILVRSEDAAPSGAIVSGLLELEALVRLPLLREATGRRLRLGLCAVLEDDAGGLSYWALRHAPGRPDFHHPDAFALELPVPGPSSRSPHAPPHIAP